MEYAFRLVGISERLWLFGISDGTLLEVLEAQHLEKPVELHLQFDPEWLKFYQQLGQKYGNPLDELIGEYVRHQG